MKTRWLIIGCGYLGQPLAARLAAGGATVWASTRSAERAEQFRSLSWRPVRLDVTAPDAGDPLPVVDVVVWAVGFDRSSGRAMSAVYVDGLRAVLARLPELPPSGRLIYVSSTSVLGQSDSGWVDEDSPAEPTTESGRVCWAAEQALIEWASRARANGTSVGRAGSPSVNVLRMSGIYGADRWPGLTALQAGRALPGRPERWLNLIHVHDAASAVIAAAEVGVPGRTYLVSDDEPTRRGDYYRELAAHFGTAPPSFAEGADGDRSDRRIRNARLRAELGVTLRYPSFRAALAER